MTAFRACLRYELLMQLRKRSLWITMGALAGLTVVANPANVGKVFVQPDPAAAMVFAAQLITLLLPVGFGVLLADRIIRDERLGVRQVLEATPAGPDARLGGKYLGACLAVGLPIIGSYLLLAAGHVVRHGDVAALGYAMAIAVAALAPALLFVGASAMLCPLLMPAPLFRVLFVGYWFWANLVDPAMMPTLNRTLLRPVSGYVIALFHDDGDLAGPVPGGALNLLRPAPTPAVALVSVAVLLVMAVLALAGARALLARTTR